MTENGSAHESPRVEFRTPDEVGKHLRFAVKLIQWKDGQQAVPLFPVFDAHLFVIRSLTVVPPAVTEDDKRRLVQAGVFELHQSDLQSTEDFRRIMIRILQQHFERPLQGYVAVFPLNVKPDQLEGVGIEVAGVRFVAATWQKLSDRLRVEDWETETMMERVCDFDAVKRNGVPFLAELTGRDEGAAFDRGNDAFHLLRSAYNMLALQGSVIVMMGRRNLGSLMAPPTYGIFRPTGEYVTMWFSPPAREFKPEELVLGRVERAQAILRQAGAIAAGETQTLFLDALRMYGHAVDAADRSDAFLNLWRTLELMTFRDGDRRYEMTEVVRRAAALVSNDELARGVLVASSKVRNDLVHRGRFAQEGLTEVELLRRVVEACMQSLGEIASECPNCTDLEYFYEQAPASATPKGREGLRKRARVLDFILRRSDAGAGNASG